MTIAALPTPLAASSFVGRVRELDLLERGCVAARTGRGSLFLITGEPGIGKTRLAAELGQRCVERGATVVWGRCWEGGGAPAFWPWIQILRACQPEMRQAPQETAEQIERLLAEGTAQLPNGALPGETEQQRFRLFDAISRFLRQTSESEPFLVILDDIHAADAASLHLLRFVARDLHASRMVIVATCRDAEVHRDPDQMRIFNALLREGKRLALRGLAAAEVATLCTQVAERELPARWISTLHETTEGNPFFIDEIMRLLLADGSLRRPLASQPLHLRVPVQVRDAIRRRMENLDGGVRRVLSVAAVMGREFDERVLAQVVDQQEQPRDVDVFDALREAVARELLVEMGNSPGRYRFAHMLIADTLYHDLPSAERYECHSAVGSVLEQLYSVDPEPQVAELAFHFCRAPVSQAAKAFDYAVRAAARARRLLAFEEAAKWYEQALATADTAGTTLTRRCELLILAADAHRYAGNMTPAATAYKRAASFARELKAPLLLARAAAGYGHSEAETGVVNATLVALLEEALATLPPGDSVQRVLVLSRLAVALYFSPNDTRRVQASEQALEMAQRVGDNTALAESLLTRHFALWEPGHASKRIQYANRLLKLGERLADHDVIMDGLAWRIADLLELGDVGTARAEIEAFVRLAHDGRRIRDQWHGCLLRSAVALFQGQLEQAEEWSQRAFELGYQSEARNAAQFFGVQTFLLHYARGSLAQIASSVEALVEQHASLPVWRCGLAFLWCEIGRVDAASAVLAGLAARRFRDLPRDLNWLPSLCFLAEVCARLDATDHAADLQTLLLPYAESNVVIATGAGLCGSVLYFLGRLAATQRRWEEAGGFFERAYAANSGMGAAIWAAQTQYAWAEMYLRSQPANPELLTKAGVLAQQAYAAAQGLGLQALMVHAAQLQAELRQGQSLPAASDASSARIAGGAYVLKREGEYWSLRSSENTIRLKDSKGVRYLAQLLRHPDTLFHATHLQNSAAAWETEHDSGAAARQNDQARWRELHAELEAAQSASDPLRIESAQLALDALSSELVRMAGWGDRQGKAGADAERARLNVTRAIAAALRRIRSYDATIGRNLANTVRTGSFCVYAPAAAPTRFRN